jgi:hypothetical protein
VRCEALIQCVQAFLNINEENVRDSGVTQDPSNITEEELRERLEKGMCFGEGCRQGWRAQRIFGHLVNE